MGHNPKKNKNDVPNCQSLENAVAVWVENRVELVWVAGYVQADELIEGEWDLVKTEFTHEI